MTEAALQSAVAREDLCRYLAACYYEPEPAFAEEGVFSALLAAAQAIDADLARLAQQLAEAFRTTAPEQLLLDYSRLFLGPTSVLAQPYGSVWLEEAKTLMGDSTMAVIALYGEGGFEVDAELLEVPDHIAVELEFLYLLVFREHEARRQGDRKQQDALVALRKRFLEQHLGRWVRPFAAAVRAGATTPFYRTLATLTERVVEAELVRV